MFLNIWGDADHASWPEQIDDHLFLGDVVNLVGDLLFPGEWDQADMLSRPITLREVPIFREQPVQPPVSLARSDLRLAPVPPAEQQLTAQRRRHDEQVAEITAHNAEAARINGKIGPSRARADAVRKAVMAAGRLKLILTAYYGSMTLVLHELEPAAWAGDEAWGIFNNCAISGRSWMSRGDQIRSNFVFVEEGRLSSVDWHTVAIRRTPRPLTATPPAPVAAAPPSKPPAPRWTEAEMTAEIRSWTDSNASRDRDDAWLRHFRGIQSTHQWDNRSFRRHWSTALGSEGRPGPTPRSAQ